VDAPAVPGTSEGAPEAKKVTRTTSSSTLSRTLSPAEVASVGAAALLAGLAYWLWPAVKSGGVGLFSRVATEDLLQNPQRARIVQIVESEAGIHHRELERRVGLGRGALEHHLRKLITGGLLLSHRGPGYTCYFPKRTGAGAMRAAPALKSDTAQALLDLVRRRPGVTLSEAALTLGVSVGTIHHHTKRMATAGVLTSTRQGASVRLTATTLGSPAAAAS
jgi:DNA-binding transcriptional ArsR family regulator